MTNATNMIKITRHFPDPIINTGISFDINDPSSFKEAFEKLKAYNEAKKDALADALGFSENVETKTSEAVKTSEKTGNAVDETPKFNTSLRWHTSSRENAKYWQGKSVDNDLDEWVESVRTSAREINERTANTWRIPLGKDQLLGFMEEIERAIENGESFVTAFQKQIDKYARPEEGIISAGSNEADLFYVNPYTGEVKHAIPRTGRFQPCQERMNTAEDAVWDLAYDLQRFLKLRVFGETDGMTEEEVEAEIADIKARQNGKNYVRFTDLSADDKCECCGRSINEHNEALEDEEASDTETEEAIDKFIKELAEHQERMNLQRHNGGYGKKKSANEASEIYGETRSRVFKGLSA